VNDERSRAIAIHRFADDTDMRQSGLRAGRRHQLQRGDVSGLPANGARWSRQLSAFARQEHTQVRHAPMVDVRIGRR